MTQESNKPVEMLAPTQEDQRYPLTGNGLAQWTYGPWRISYEPKPIPTTACDYDWWHDDFDGAPDAGDSRCGTAGSPEACIAAIHEWEDDQ
jgi:hypothetical protein